jgi:5-methylcytosine-specific restriction endonuclease McrA
MITTITKICLVCNKELPATTEYFVKNYCCLYGLDRRCKECDKEHRRKNKAKIAETQRLGRIKNIEKAKARQQRYYESHKNDELQRSRFNFHKRTSAKLGLHANLTVEEWEYCLSYFNGHCAYCGKEVELTQEHVIPVSKGGTYTKDNIICACMECNTRKQKKNMQEWLKSQSFFTEEGLYRIEKYLELMKES